MRIVTRRTIKQVLIMLMILAMLVPTTAMAAEPDIVKVKEGTLTWLFTESESFEVPSTVNTIESISATHALRAKNLKNLVIPSSVTTIKGGAFQGHSNYFPNLETVKVPSTVKIIQAMAFANNKKLKIVTLEQGTTEILDNAFQNATALKEIKYPDGLTILGQQSFENSGLVKVDVPGTVKVIEIGVYRNNINMIEAKVNEGTVEIKDEAFGGNINMTSLYLPKSLTKAADNMFNRASAVNTSKLTIYTYKGSYAEEFAKKKGIKCVLLDAPATVNPPVVVNPPAKVDTTVAQKAGNGEGLYMAYSKPVTTVKKAVKFNPERYFETKLWKDKTYDVAIWQPNTELKFTWKFESQQYFGVEYGYLIEKNGKMDLFTGDYSVDFTGDLNVFEEDEFGRVSQTVTAPKTKINFTDVDGKKYTENSKEMYAYIVYRYMNNEIKKTYTPDKYYDYTHLLIFKLGGEVAVTPPAATKPVATKTVTATPTASAVLVNGKKVAFDAYTINGNNYFKLRDVAMAVKGSDKQFGVGFDSSKNAINLLSNTAYTVAGGELAKGDGKAKAATLSTSTIYKDGTKVALTAYTINGNNYFKLRDLAQAFNIGVTWNGSTNTLGIDTSIGYAGQ